MINMGVGKPQLSKVTIGGIDVTDYLISWNKEDSSGSNFIRGASIDLDKSITNVINLDNDLFSFDNKIIITRGVNNPTEHKIFEGIITSYKTTGSIVYLECLDPLYIATKKTVVYSWDRDIDPEAGKISEIFKNIINNYTDGLLIADDTSVNDSGTVNTLVQFIANSDTVYDLCKRLADYINWIFYYDPRTGKVNFQPKGYTNNSTILEEGVNIIGTIKWNINESTIYNDIRVDGAVKEANTQETGRIGTTEGYTTDYIQLNHTPKNTRVLCDASNPPITQRSYGVVSSTLNYDYYTDETKKRIYWNKNNYTPVNGDYVIINYTYDRPVPVTYTDEESVDKYEKRTKNIKKDEINTVADAKLFAEQYVDNHKDPLITSRLQVTDISDLEIDQTIRVIDYSNNIDKEFKIESIKMSYPYSSDEIKVTSQLIGEGEYLVWVNLKIKELSKRNQNNYEDLVHTYSKVNPYYWENAYLEIQKNSDIIYLNHNYDKYIENFYNTQFKDDLSTGIWSTNSNAGYLVGSDNLISKDFTINKNTQTDNYYNKAYITLEGYNLDNLNFYIGENNNTNTIYNEVELSGTSTNKTGEILLSGINKYGINWKIDRPDSPTYAYYNKNYINDGFNYRGWGLDISSDDKYIAIASVRGIKILKRSAYEYKLLDDIYVSQPNDTTINSVSFSPDTNYLVAGTNSNCIVLKRNGDYFNYLTEISTTKTDCSDFDSTGDYIAIGSEISPYFKLYKRNGDVFTQLSNPTDMPTSYVANVRFSNINNYLATINDNEKIIIYKRSGDTFTKLANPDVMPTGPTCVDFNSDDTYMAIGDYNSDNTKIYSVSNDTFTKVNEITTQNIRAIEYSSNDSILYAAMDWVTVPLKVFSVNGTTYTDITTGYLDIDLPHDSLFTRSIKLTSDDLFLVVEYYNSITNENSPYFYKRDFRMVQEIDIKYIKND